MADYTKGRLVARWGSWYGVPDAYHAIMPMLSGAAWKILTDLCYRSRSVDSLFPGQRGLQLSCGIASRETIADAITELVVATVLTVRRETGISNTYGLQLPTAPIRTDEAQAAVGQMALRPGEVSVQERLERLARARAGARRRAKAARPVVSEATPPTGATPTGAVVVPTGVVLPPSDHIPSNHPAIQAWRAVTRRYPSKVLYGYIVERLGTKPNVERLRTIYTEWAARAHNPLSVSGVLDVYLNGWREHGAGRATRPSNAERTRSAFDNLIGTGATEPEAIEVRPLNG